MFITAKTGNTAQKMKFAIKDFFSKCDQIRTKMGSWPNLSSVKDNLEDLVALETEPNYKTKSLEQLS